MCQAWARAGNNSLYLHGDYVGVGSAVNEQSVNKHTVRFRVGNLRSKRKVSEARGTADWVPMHCFLEEVVFELYVRKLFIIETRSPGNSKIESPK